jgi:hypothetical protein
MTREHDQAFPTSGFAYADGSYEGGTAGLTIREHFASMAMAAVAKEWIYYDPDGKMKGVENAIRVSVELADALIVELNKQTT